MTKLAPVLDTLQQQVVDHVHMHGNFPNDVHLESETNLYAYDVTLWTSSKQTAIMQGMINGRQFGLAPGLGGMFTCLLANRNESVESKCFYQVKQM
ncbi:MAG TPA: hypothetical protein VLG38_05885 [Gammaproteobacteria bacterium]|nr:hypothetical protein [Gammaproteobacteria bacterium]